MTRGLESLMTMLVVMLIVYSWVWSTQVKYNSRQKDRRRQFSLPPKGREAADGHTFDLPPQNWPQWATAEKVVAPYEQDDLDEGISAESTPSSDLDRSTEEPANDMIIINADDTDQAAVDLAKAIIWSEILQPPLSLRQRRR